MDFPKQRRDVDCDGETDESFGLTYVYQFSYQLDSENQPFDK